MRKHVTTALLLGALCALPIAGVAAAQAPAAAKPAPAASKQAPATAKKSASASVATHATRGTVKSIDDTSLVIAGTGKNKADMTFVLNPATHREGTAAVGSHVSVRYKQEGTTHVATAVTVQGAKADKGAAKK